jgi:hypothetical protein
MADSFAGSGQSLKRQHLVVAGLLVAAACRMSISAPLVAESFAG